MMGDLHRQRRLRHLPTWRPRVGRHGRDRRRELEHCLARTGLVGRAVVGPAGRLVTDAAPRCAGRAPVHAARRGGRGSPERWVVSHGGPHAANLVRTPDGHRLVGWGALALAPRERDLRLALGDAESEEPWFAYLEAGGVPEPARARRPRDVRPRAAPDRGHRAHAALRRAPRRRPRRAPVLRRARGELGALLGRWGGRRTRSPWSLRSGMTRVLSAVAWPYANGPRHIGHVAGFGVPSDVFSRYMRMAGHDVLMVSGTDEHGTPILVAADAAGVTPQELADTQQPAHRRGPARPRPLLRPLHPHHDPQPLRRGPGAVPHRPPQRLLRRADHEGAISPVDRAHAARPLHRGHLPDLRLRRARAATSATTAATSSTRPT